ncbi:flavin reductase family protein [Paucilactobacillus wasatchensis]|uniref:Nitrilotriacetate monooxygenase component B n=1 Tax=Paucilactobacillus wasatchensis TaxID=1335616 RepID=A0A0D0YUP8_9LACO|nr:flavin reductase family protein [Paucilactobacillus wasatchensis]KIS02979.1 Nitrilotriacetate monooxygenase component B [Paucilactobacillus wasatchensis]
MIHFEASELSTKQQYKFISGSIIPRPIAWVTSLADNGIVNLAPFSFFSGLSNQLPLLSLAILRNQDGTMKDTASNILNNGQAVVHTISESLAEQMNLTAASVDSDTSELNLTSLKTTPSVTVTPPSLVEPLIRFETNLFQYVPIEKNDGIIITDLLILQITDFFFNPSVFDQEKNYILNHKLNLIGRLAGNEYTLLGKTFSLTRPK